MTVDELLEHARARLCRVDPESAGRAAHEGALLVDIRPDAQRRRDGEIPGAVVVDRNVLEWRLGPTSPWRVPEVTDPGRQVIVASFTGLDETFAQPVHARHLYNADALRFGAKFVDIFSITPRGERVIDYSRFHDVAPV